MAHVGVGQSHVFEALHVSSPVQPAAATSQSTSVRGVPQLSSPEARPQTALWRAQKAVSSSGMQTQALAVQTSSVAQPPLVASQSAEEPHEFVTVPQTPTAHAGAGQSQVFEALQVSSPEQPMAASQSMSVRARLQLSLPETRPQEAPWRAQKAASGSGSQTQTLVEQVSPLWHMAGPQEVVWPQEFVKVPQSEPTGQTAGAHSHRRVLVSQTWSALASQPAPHEVVLPHALETVPHSEAASQTGSGQMHCFVVPSQTSAAVQALRSAVQSMSVRALPQLSSAVRRPHSAPRRPQKLESVSGSQTSQVLFTRHAPVVQPPRATSQSTLRVVPQLSSTSRTPHCLPRRPQISVSVSGSQTQEFVSAEQVVRLGSPTGGQVPQPMSTRVLPQLSSAVTRPHEKPARWQNCEGVSGTQPQVLLEHDSLASQESRMSQSKVRDPQSPSTSTKPHSAPTLAQASWAVSVSTQPPSASAPVSASPESTGSPVSRSGSASRPSASGRLPESMETRTPSTQTVSPMRAPSSVHETPSRPEES